MARKPLSEKTIVDNVIKCGTGGINIDECRVGMSDTDIETNTKKASKENNGVNFDVAEGKTKGTATPPNTQGRFPANIIFDEEAGKILDEQSGTVRMASNVNGIEHHSKMNFTPGEESKVKQKQINVKETKGGASRFFYCPKASKKDRNEGIEGNIHPTVKPTDLMAYLVRMITPKGGTVLDPFMGSGSTGKASVREGMNFVGIEREDEYMEIAKTRIEWEQKKNKHTQFFDV
jgi:site-specific DNA-methyltransferase (adenine-specific)